MVGFLHDLRATLRALGKAPVFLIVTVLTLAVSIGAITAIYSVVYSVLFRPLPYPDADRLVRVVTRAMPPNVPGGELVFSDRGYWHFLENNIAFDEFGGVDPSVQWALTGQGQPVQLEVARMTASAFALLGVGPRLGRLPAPEEDVPGGPRVVLIGEALWREVFGADPAVVGRRVELDGFAWEVIGVMPDGYDFPTPETDAWVPSALDRASSNYGGHHIAGLARLAPGSTVASAKADAEALIARFPEVGYEPSWFTGIFTGEAAVRTLKEDIVGDARRPLLILLATMGFVLLIACSNVANLFLVRAEARTRDTAVRIALGSGRGRLVRFVLAEGVLLGLIGGAAGVGLAWAGVRLLVALGPASVPRLGEIGIHPPVLAFTAGVSVVAGLLFALLPALGTTSPRILRSLGGSGRSAPAGRERHRARNALVVTQVALAMVLFVASALMVESFTALGAVDPGYDPQGVLTFRVSPAPARYQDDESVTRFYDSLLESLGTLPGVISAGAVDTLPLTGGGSILTTRIEEFPPAEDAFPPVFSFRRAAPGYFESMGIPIIEGRTLTADDHNRRLGTLLISKSVKDAYWPDSSALGKRIQVAGPPGSVVGVVGNLHDAGLDEPSENFVYKPMLDAEGGGVRAMTVTLRTEREPLDIVPEIRRVVQSLDPDLPLTDVRSMEAVVGDSLSRTSFSMAVLTLGAVIALFLGAVGVYGVIAYDVSRRTGEIGVRQALGADPARIRRLVLGEGMRVGAAGVALGLVSTLLAGRVLRSQLYGVSPYDVPTLAAGLAVFLAVAVLASAIPAARAARIPPAIALRPD